VHPPPGRSIAVTFVLRSVDHITLTYVVSRQAIRGCCRARRAVEFRVNSLLLRGGLYNNLDESSEIGLCNMSAPTNTGIQYGAKVSRAVFHYVYASGSPLCTNSRDCSGLATARGNAIDTLPQTGGLCELPATAPKPTLSLPCGDLSVAGDDGEGAIEIKAAWRQLTAGERACGRFSCARSSIIEAVPIPPARVLATEQLRARFRSS
jgi:hypothetical protein